MSLAIIPARGGSKRIPRKNIKIFRGKPMIAWSIDTARDSGLFDRIIVSTDDDEIAEIAEEHGAEAPFIRPSDLADDHTPTVPVVAHAIKALEAYDPAYALPDVVCCIYACAPLMLANDLITAKEKLDATKADYAFPVTSFPFPIQRAVVVTGNDKVEMLYPEHALTRSQDLKEAFHDVGQFYFGRLEAWTEKKAVMGPNSTTIKIPRTRAQDIDTQADWNHAEALFSLSKT